MDNFAATKILLNVAVCLKRSVVIAGVEQNLLAPKREEILKKFASSHFKKIAQVAIGDPDKNYLKLQEDLTREHMQKSKNKQIAAQRAQLTRDRETEKKQRDATRRRIKTEREKKKGRFRER